ncbi:MAG: hypothetical protein NWE88_03560 [Candidatus Bathyarchaeota archaeon]|nr:hypothetical protein [Candidatus Bathyarchaeota archaeon]
MVRMIAGKLIERTTEEEAGVVVVNPTVTWNPSASAVESTLKDWNRNFTEGTLTEWTYVGAEISTEDPYDGLYCVNLTETGAYILQTLDEPLPVNSVYEFSVWLKRPNGVTSRYILRMHHTDGTTNDVSGSLTSDGWQRVYFERSMMWADKILSSISIRSYEVSGGQLFVDSMFLGLATEIITGSVDAYVQGPRALGRVFNTAITANTDIFSADLEPSSSATTFRIYACMNTAGVLTVRRTRGGTTVSEDLNAGANLVANSAYMFEILVEELETINLQYDVNATVISLKVFELTGAVS